MKSQSDVGIAAPPVQPRRWFRLGSAHPGRIALLWLVGTVLCVVDLVLFPQDAEPLWVSQILSLAGTSIFSALIASAVLRVRTSALWLAARFAEIFVVLEAVWLLCELDAALSGRAPPLLWLFVGAMMFFFSLAIWLGFQRVRSRRRRLVAILVALMVQIAGPAMAGLDEMFWQLSADARPLLDPSASETDEEDDSHYWKMEADRLWEAQPTLLEKAIGAIRPPVAAEPNFYGLAVAAQGSQTIFSREAHLALEVMTARYGSAFRGGVLLSNGEADILRSPLATNGNISAVAKAIAAKADPARDVAIIYLASHGGRDAALGTDLPDYRDLGAISSTSLAKALDGAGVRRRVIIVSACFAASWSSALANDNTILIAAAARDRTSFGCSDERRLTYFGEAFLTRRLAKGASLQDSFVTAKQTVTRWEKKEGMTPSMPQAFVGRNMTALWTERRGR